MNLKGFGLLAVGFLLLTACGGKKHDMALYEARIDSLRKAEQLMQLKKTAGVFDDPWKNSLTPCRFVRYLSGRLVETLADWLILLMFQSRWRIYGAILWKRL